MVELAIFGEPPCLLQALQALQFGLQIGSVCSEGHALRTSRGIAAGISEKRALVILLYLLKISFRGDGVVLAALDPRTGFWSERLNLGNLFGDSA